MASNQDYNSPEYKSWRFFIFKRFEWTCVLCHKKGGKMQAHHVKRVADRPDLKYSSSNGVCLCEHCHQNIVTGHEERFVEQFREIVAQKKIQAANIRAIRTGKKKKGKKKYKPRPPGLRF